MNLVRVLEPRADVRSDVEQNHVVLGGAQRVTQTINVADSSQLLPSTPVTAMWSINPPSNQTIVDRFMRVRAYMEIEADADFQIGTNDALRQFPLSSIVDVTTLQINGESISDNTADKLHAMLCFGNDAEDRRRSWSTSPCMPDAFQKYSDYVALGTNKSPLAFYGETASEDPRGGFQYEVIAGNKIRVVVTEPVFVSPLYNGLHSQREGMVNVNQINLNLRFKSDTSLVWSHSDTGNAITSVTCKFYQAPELLVTYLTPDSLQPIPDVQVLPYMKPQEYIKNVGTIPTGATTDIFSDSVRLSQIPRLVYLFCRRDQASSNYGVADAFLGIESVSVNWGNQSGLLASATKQDLFEISRRNGCELSWQQFSGYRGSVLCLEMGKDIGLPDSQAPGCQGSYTLQVNMRVKNLAADSYSANFYMVTMNEGTFSVAQNSARASIGNLSPEMVLGARNAPHVPHYAYQQLSGGSFWSGLKNVLGSVARTGANLAGAVGSAFGQPQLGAAVGTLADSAARALGKGRGKGGSRLVGGSLRRR
jgi:hypothetical protein